MILSAGLSPAWQQILVYDRIRPGEVNRAARVFNCAAGKVLNAARTVRKLGADGLAVTLLGGPAGEAMRRFLEEEGVVLGAVPSRTPSRTCTTLVERSTATVTELVENAGPVAPDELDAYRDTFRQAARHADFIVLAGSLPVGSPETLFRELVADLDVPVLADIRGPELLHLLPLRPRVVKPNRQELARTLGRPVNTDGDLREAMRRVNELGAEWVVISQGAGELWASRAEEFHRFVPPAIDAVNPIGSGDALAAAMAVGLVEGLEMIEAIRLGIAAGVENAARLLLIDIDRAAVLGRMEEVRRL